MILKSNAIVLHSFKFGESSLILKVYSEQSGLISCMVHGVRKSKSQNKAALFQTLNRLELVYYQKNKDQMVVVKEVKLTKSYSTLHSDMRKTSIALFVAEVLLKSFKEEQSNPNFYRFLEQEFDNLDIAESNFSNIHLEILMQIAFEHGIKPMNNYSQQACLFDMQNGMFVEKTPEHTNYLSTATSLIFNQLILKTEKKSEPLLLKREERKHLLIALIQYLKIHLSGFGELKSLEILEEILSEG